MNKTQGKFLKTIENFHDANAPWVILFHGYGADAHDLSSLGDVIPCKTKCNWLFPNGPVQVPIGPGWTGSAWWNLDIEKIQRESAQGIVRSMSDESPKELPEVRQKVMQMIENLKVPWSKIILGGFSQGGMLATDIAVHAPEKPAGLVLMSSGLINKAHLNEKIQTNHPWIGKSTFNFYQSHGMQDPVINYKNAQQLNEYLKGPAKMTGQFRSFQGVHEIPLQVIQEIGTYVDSITSNK